MSYRFSGRRRIRMTIRKQKNEQRTAAAGLLLISFFCITIFSRSSFLYERNPWSDANIFLTIGRGMLKGKKMYTDLFDHKGPLLYVLYAIAAMISDRSFAGVYLIEVLSLFWFLWECWKLLKLLQTEHPFPGLLLIAIAIVTSKAFSFGGGSVQELALPLLMHCLVLSLKRILAEESFSKKDCFLICILASAVFLMIFTLCGFFAGIHEFHQKPAARNLLILYFSLLVFHFVYWQYLHRLLYSSDDLLQCLPGSNHFQEDESESHDQSLSWSFGSMRLRLFQSPCDWKTRIRAAGFCISDSEL